MGKLSIIIVNYNTASFVKECINSITNNYRTDNKEIIVVDNNSSNRDIDRLNKEFLDVKFINSDKNVGFGGGCNIGVKNSNSEYILFLNPDIKVKENSITILLDYIKSNENVGVCSGILTDDSGEILYSYNDFPGLSWEFREAFGLFLKSKINELTSKQEIKKKIPFEVDWFHGACMCIRRDVFDQVGGFDENIFLYYEDVDLQKKIKESGYKIVCVPTAEFNHFERSSVREGESYKIYHYYMHISKIYYYRKYKMDFKLLIIRIFYITGSCIKIISLFFRPKKWKVFSIRIYQYKIIIYIYLNLMKNIHE